MFCNIQRWPAIFNDIPHTTPTHVKHNANVVYGPCRGGQLCYPGSPPMHVKCNADVVYGPSHGVAFVTQVALQCMYNVMRTLYMDPPSGPVVLFRWYSAIFNDIQRESTIFGDNQPWSKIFNTHQRSWTISADTQRWSTISFNNNKQRSSKIFNNIQQQSTIFNDIQW